MMSTPASTQIPTEDRVRLHITPFNPDLVDRIIPPSLKPLTSNISFHSVQTFPERGFGFVELPTMEAQKLKKKLNGSTLRGAKVRIEEARPEKKRKSDDEDDNDERKVRKAAKKERKKREEVVIHGHELEEGRKVKRGWTEDAANQKSSKRTSRSKEDLAVEADSVSEGKKLRFKTIVPPNASPIETQHNSKTKPKEGKESKKDKKVVVQEFGKHTTHSAASDEVESADHGNLSYEEGKGWINEAGNIVESERKSRRRKSSGPIPVLEPRISAIESREVPDDTPAQLMTPPEPAGDNDISLNDVDETVELESTKEVHPLEALFKRPLPKSSPGPKRKPKPINTAFSFFDQETAAGEDDMTGGIDMPPQTPHTKRDLEWRSIRSAAPTPDTAALGRKMSFPFASNDEDDEDDANEGADVEMVDAGAGAVAGVEDGTGEGEESAFRKWFYENRGDLNRGWKKRRRDERKVKRQRENRRTSGRVA